MTEEEAVEMMTERLAGPAEPAGHLTRRTALRRALFGLFGGFISGSLLELFPAKTKGSPINSDETIIVLPREIQWNAWTGLPPHIGEMALLYGALDQPGPYLAFMKWYPGYMSAPHTYATDRLSVVVSGTWWVNSGEDFAPDDCVAVPAGGFVRRVARTPHYDGVMKQAKHPAIIAIFGLGPVDLELVDPSQPGWREL